jgi:outer membrane protein assembly factor BamB
MQPSEGSLYASPLATAFGIVCATLDAWLVSVSPETGETLWSRSLGQPIFTSPLYCPHRELVYAGSVNRTFYAVSARDGELIWQQSTQAPIFSSPVLYEKSLLFGCHDRGLYRLDASTGCLIWRHALHGEIFASPDYESGYGGRIVAATSSGTVYLVSPGGETLASWQLSGLVFSSPLFLAGRIIVGSRDNFLYCYAEESQS